MLSWLQSYEDLKNPDRYQLILHLFYNLTPETAVLGWLFNNDTVFPVSPLSSLIHIKAVTNLFQLTVC